MRRFLALLLAAFIALMPLMGIACDAGAKAAQDLPCHAQDADPAENAPASCDMKDCCAAVLLPKFPEVRSAAVQERAFVAPRLAAGFVTPPENPPPVLR
jgi:hypothetical protein